MDKILLIVSSPYLSRLYHELLFDKKRQFIIIEDLSQAVAFMAIDKFEKIILFTEDQENILLFLYLIKNKKSWSKTGLIIITDDIDKYKKHIRQGDYIFGLAKPEVIINELKKIIIGLDEEN